MELSGKHALVTGGGTGIGLAIAQALAAAGAQVTISGRRMEVLQDVAIDGLHPLVMDVTEPEQVVAGVEDAVAARGPVQICVPNAGIAEGRSITKMDLDFWRRTMATNLDGAMLTIQACLPSMLTTDWGRVIAVSSIAGVRGLRGAPAYSASKHGLIGLIRGLSEDYMGGPYTFNALCPGYVDTEIVTRNTAEIAKRAGLSEEDALGTMVRSNRHKRLIKADEIGAAALWLCGAGSGSVNGQTIEIAGGQV
ncbi:NAD(P)-dependent dehydrogenase, short-chain alcohol dehydrogenase family [Litoreibacter ascidiaceicola]|uniref:NAD(P)-dependent dehydrogenase, short-chain alcohol dehydrogenase family n=1 Tax=Litoreibacter ascidiaceicola TaxID=1486859 RepID=A0A1M4TTK4_9RHOB|nr:SDR family oxidoreductase [Litoreibacter ascidiaceicola]SHE47811.1 NAD(P)-dependent dehydrogenase, short-chain alcohol dehydrogenase family [Litoreibacter ascidiaceicola]